MTSNASNVLFDDIFTINAIDKEGKKFDRGAPRAAPEPDPPTDPPLCIYMRSVASLRAFKKLRHGSDARL